MSSLTPPVQAGSKQFPLITPVAWLPAKQVLGGEASDFTPWLAQPHVLETLGTALKLDGLTTIAQEHPVLGKRLDILATAQDERGEEVAVCIENQYGMSDADHLGRLVAYLAQHESGRAVWVVEEAHDAYVAAVRFLNRTSVEEVGYYLVQVRFTHGDVGSFQVHFEVLAAPIAWERPPTQSKKPVNLAKVDWVRSLTEAARPALQGAGFPSMNAHIRGNYMWVRWPQDLWFRKFGKLLHVRITKSSLTVAVLVGAYKELAQNETVVELLHKELGDVVAEHMPAHANVTWGIPSPQGRRSAILVSRDDIGYPDGDIEEAAEWVNAVVIGWLSMIRDHPMNDLEGQVLAVHGTAVTADDSDEDD